MKSTQLKYLFNSETKIKSSWNLFTSTYNKHAQASYPIKKRKKLHKLITKLGKELL